MVAVTQTHPLYTYTKRGVYYFNRYVPSDLRSHYRKHRIVKSLKTSSARDAARSARMLAAKLDQVWLDMRLKKQLEEAESWLVAADTSATISSAIKLSGAVEQYIETKGVGRAEHFKRSAARYGGYIIKCLGDKPIDVYTSTDAVTFRNWLQKKGLSKSSVLRTFNSARAIFNFIISEHGLECRNPFSGVYLPAVDDAEKRTPVKGKVLKRIQDACHTVDDDVRWLVALISDTGMRLGEAAGLLVNDIDLTHPIPHVTIRPHSHRTLKTTSSHRTIPLCGSALWAAKRIIESSTSYFCFPRYNTTQSTNANSASATCNKWLKTITKQQVVIHGLRHGMRDRLRDVDAPTELIDQIGGWSLQSIGQNYGDGFNLDTLSKWLKKACI